MKLKINYSNENYKGQLFAVIVFIIVLLFILIWFTVGRFWENVSTIVLFSICVIMVLPWLIFSLIDYKKRKRNRNMNLYIMKNGYSVEGKIISIVDRKSTFNNGYRLEINRTVVATVEYNIETNTKVVVVDNLLINYRKIKQYQDKKVKIYIYNNMNYVDILN